MQNDKPVTQRDATNALTLLVPAWSEAREAGQEQLAEALDVDVRRDLAVGGGRVLDGEQVGDGDAAGVPALRLHRDVRGPPGEQFGMRHGGDCERVVEGAAAVLVGGAGVGAVPVRDPLAGAGAGERAEPTAAGR